MKLGKETTKTWQQYEAGKDYKRRIRLYDRVRTNEKFLIGEQWQNADGTDLPKPVFNVIKRIVDYLICTMISSRVSIIYTDEDLPFIDDTEKKKIIKDGIDLLTKNASYRWEKCKMDKILKDVLYDAAISGDGAVYSYYDPGVRSSQAYSGDIVTKRVDSTNIFASDMNTSDIQGQNYIIISGRESVYSLKCEAVKNGMSATDAHRLIVSDSENDNEYGSPELSGDDEEKATYLIKFWREDGYVCFEKSTKNCVIRRQRTKMRRYPIAYFNWSSTADGFHGTPPVTALIQNQKYINRGFAMAMKHMTDTAFSKVIYDKSKIPEWSNRIGEAVAVVGATNVSDAVSVIGTGEMQEGYLELLNTVISLTKEVMGATESALGSVDPTNTSAILALQEASKVPLIGLRDNLISFAEDIACVWADMMCAYYPKERLIPYFDRDEGCVGRVNFDVLRDTLIEAKVEISDPARYSVVNNRAVLDKLLEGGYITVDEYIERLPDGMIEDREKILKRLRTSGFSDEKKEDEIVVSKEE